MCRQLIGVGLGSADCAGMLQQPRGQLGAMFPRRARVMIGWVSLSHIYLWVSDPEMLA